MKDILNKLDKDDDTAVHFYKIWIFSGIEVRGPSL